MNFKLKFVNQTMIITAIISFSLCLIFLPYMGYLVWHSVDDYQQINAVKIMYIHVPSSWLAIMMFISLFFQTGAAFILKSPIVLISSFETAKIGFMFNILSLITGAIWGRPIWGVYWVWDGRLTGMFFMALIYMLYVFFYINYDKHHNKDKIMLVIAWFGGLNLIILKFSTEYWLTLHQSSSFWRKGGISMSWNFLKPLTISFFTMSCWAIFLVSSGVIVNLYKHKQKNHDLYSNR